ncbi:MAG: hypothetical protein QF560_20185 [SAR324 cluster bacterium]|jgi:hypothetical protein|nr:hypothetical protein [SAR324 cluster bacterium]MDP7140683.1 hypothetical protein [SAR324 cluster bacterium]MDP7498376.1 hypothetical protein [SAR324 cluster bacterium]HJO46360.1 hypothetical protein [SAR324 cluster bacterium]
MRSRIQSPVRLFKRNKDFFGFLNLFELFLNEYRPNKNNNNKKKKGLKKTNSITSFKGTGILAELRRDFSKAVDLGKTFHRDKHISKYDSFGWFNQVLI